MRMFYTIPSPYINQGLGGSIEYGAGHIGSLFLGGGLAFIGVQSIAVATVLNRKYAPSYKISTWLCYQYITISNARLITPFVNIPFCYNKHANCYT